jgi:hypothetical protein
MSVSAIPSVGAYQPSAQGLSPQESKLRQSVRQAVGQLMYGPMMKMARENPFKGPYGHGGRGEEIFRAQLDSELIRRASSRIDGSLSESLYEHLARGIR